MTDTDFTLPYNHGPHSKKYDVPGIEYELLYPEIVLSIGNDNLPEFWLDGDMVTGPRAGYHVLPTDFIGVHSYLTLLEAYRCTSPLDGGSWYQAEAPKYMGDERDDYAPKFGGATLKEAYLHAIYYYAGVCARTGENDQF